MCQNIHVAVLPITESDRRVPCYQRISQLFDMYGAKVIDFDVSGKKCKVIIEISDENLTEFIYHECISQKCISEEHTSELQSLS